MKEKLVDNASFRSSDEESSFGSEESFDNSMMTGHGASSTEGDDLLVEEEVHFTRRETTLVNRSKALVYFVLTIAAVAVSAVVYKFLKRDEENTMKAEFSAYSREILKQAEENSANMFEEIWDMSKAITSHALDSEMTWPNVTLPHFDTIAHDERSRVEFIGFAPFVTPETRQGWEQYSVDNQGWIAQDYSYRNWNETPPSIPTKIHRYNTSFLPAEFEEEMFRYEVPLWQVAPAPRDTSEINLDLATLPVFGHLLRDVSVKKVEQYSRIVDLGFLLGEDNVDDHPRGTIYQPVFQDFREDADVVGFVMGSLTWDNMFEHVLFDSSASLLVEIEGTCNAIFTYIVTGDSIDFRGYGQGLRDPKFDRYKQSADLLTPKEARPGYEPVKHTHRSTDATHDESHCTYVMNTYPTEEFVSTFSNNEPIYFTLVVASVFLLTALIFLLYDYLVKTRQQKLMSTAKRTNALLSTLFPKDVQEQLMQEAEKDNKRDGKCKSMTDFVSNQDDTNGQNVAGTPIADLFPSATVMFADIAGFTAWSSTREPTHVFRLLESLYNSFDMIARKRKVFKVETIGDCYVAVCGLPHPNVDHALTMAKFARDCLFKMRQQLDVLETSLGPDTTKLGMRVGIHTGPVTAGVLRGERARFQLFGDTVNTTARIESTGAKNRIHLSEQTASVLIDAGKEHWVTRRSDMVEAKGKGKLQTFWLKTGEISPSSTGSHEMRIDERAGSSSASQEMPSESMLEDGLSMKDLRLVDWNVEVLGRLLRQIEAQRRVSGKGSEPQATLKALQLQGKNYCSIFQEVKEIIDLPTFNADSGRDFADESKDLQLDDNVAAELYQFVSTIATMHNHNPFHSFDHASHITLSVVKLLSRIVSPTKESANGAKSTLHDHAYSIASDPLTQFAIVLSAIIHDVSHPGVPNNTLIKEKAGLALAYNNKSVAEQNSVDLAFGLLMDCSFQHLRCAIYSSEEEFKRFRQIVINAVMATDIMDKDLGAARKSRWNTAFSEQSTRDDTVVALNRRATIVIEHLIQASDVSHTMQHWHVFAQWNQKLFNEMYKAYKEGRLEHSPVDNWYKGELGFFDFYIIPLAKKLKDCGVFGVSSDEYLTYALQNREEWESKGREQVEMYLEQYNNGAL